MGRVGRGECDTPRGQEMSDGSRLCRAKRG